MYDVVVIGGGPGGYTAALEVARRGRRAAVIEQGHMGGACLNVGCVPVKALLRAAKAFDALNRDRIGITADNVAVDWHALRHYQRETVTRLREGLHMLMKQQKVDVIEGVGHVAAPGVVAVGERMLTARHIVVATGGKPTVPSIRGAELRGVMTSDGLLHYDKPIERLAIIGGGVIGCEFAYLYNCLGAQVTVYEEGDQLLPSIGDREIPQNLAMILKRRGVVIHTRARVDEIRRGEDGLTVSSPSGEAAADVVLIATGRAPAVDGLFAPSLDVRLERSAVWVDEHFQTALPDVYAIGDASSASIGRQLAHAATTQAEVLAAYLCGETLDIRTAMTPACVYTEPEIAVIGFPPDEAKAHGLTVRKHLMGGNAKSVIDEQERGFIKLVTDQDGRLLGASLMCGRASDLIGELAVAVANGLTVADVQRAIHPHPSYCEAVWEAVKG